MPKGTCMSKRWEYCKKKQKKNMNSLPFANTWVHPRSFGVGL